MHTHLHMHTHTHTHTHTHISVVFSSLQAPLHTPVTSDKFAFLTETSRIPLPILPGELLLVLPSFLWCCFGEMGGGHGGGGEGGMYGTSSLLYRHNFFMMDV